MAVVDADNVCTGGLGASSNVACPFQAPSGRYSDDWIFDYQGESEWLIHFQPSLYIAEKSNVCTDFFENSYDFRLTDRGAQKKER